MASHKLTRRDFLCSSGTAMVAGIASQAAGEAAVAQTAQTQRSDSQHAGSVHSRPNLVLFMPDELRADALSCYGNPLTRTPNFDRLAASGTRFQNCHVQYPVCGASRCSLLTGWPTSVRGHRSLYYFLRPNEPNLFRYLREAGYDVFWYGKNDALAAETFYQSVTTWNYPVSKPSRPHTTEHRHANAHPSSPNPTTFIGHPTGARTGTGEYAFLQSAIRILNRKQADRPFCIFLPLSSPHPPYGAPDDFYNMYSPADIPNLRPWNLPKRPDYFAGIRKAYHLENVPEDTFRRVRALYYGSVSYSDWLLGELLEAVERTNHNRDTAVFVLSDHGDYAGDYGLVEKWPSGLEDVLTHVPLIAHVPGGASGHTCSNIVELFDVMATCLDLANTSARHTHFARSLMPEILGGPGDTERAAFAEGGYNEYEPQCFESGADPGELYYPKMHLQDSQPAMISRAAMIRTKDCKLVSRPQGQSELYIYKDDPRELHNRFGAGDVRDIQCDLERRLLHWYVNTTGIAPFDKDQRNLPPYYPTPEFPLGISSAADKIIG